jgi:hypothetical protein
MQLRLNFPAFLLSLGIVIAALIGAHSWKEQQRANQIISVVGSAKQDFKADLGFIRFTIAGVAATAPEGFRAMQTAEPTVRKFLAEQGFTPDQIKEFAATQEIEKQYNDKGYETNKILNVIYRKRLEVTSSDVEKLAKLALQLPALVEQGVQISVEQPEYLYTKMADLKIEVQAHAAADAKVRAERIARATGSELGPIRSARMGVLQITPRFSTVVSDYGVNDTSSIEKEITAVVQASFEISR